MVQVFRDGGYGGTCAMNVGRVAPELAEILLSLREGLHLDDFAGWVRLSGYKLPRWGFSRTRLVFGDF